jgi:hypothetical protein
MNIKLKLFFYLILIAVSSLGFADDTDGDGIDDSIDNCVSISNADQVDTDSDGIGNDCDADDDGDNVIDSQDAFPLDPKYSKDTDGDSLPDKYEQENELNYLDANDALLDIDNDGLTALEEFGYGTDHRLKDTDRDTLPDKWELQNSRDPIKSDYSLSDNCFVGDEIAMCWRSWQSYSFPDLQGIKFDKLVANFGYDSYCGISEGAVKCWALNGSALWANPPVFDDVVIDIWLGSTNYICARTVSTSICWGESDYNQGANIETQYANNNALNLIDSYVGSHSCGIGGLDFVDAINSGGGGYSKQNVINNKSIIQCWGYYNSRWGSDANYLSRFEGITGLAIAESGTCVMFGESNNKNIDCASGAKGFPPFPSLANPIHLTSARDDICSLHDGGVSCSGNTVYPFNLPNFFSDVPDQAEFSNFNGRTFCINKPSLFCWGDNYRGLLSSERGYLIHDWNEPKLLRSSAMPIRSFKRMVYACAVDGKDVKCWGGDSNIRSDNPPFSDVEGIAFSAPENSEIIDLSLTPNEICVLMNSDDSSNSAYCMGTNRLRETRSFSGTIDMAAVSDAQDNFVQCFMDSNSLSCNDSKSTIPGPSDVNGIALFNAQKVSVSFKHVCVIEQRGVLCWGDNADGQSNTVGLLNPRDIYAGDNYTCAIHDLGVKCWGAYNFDHQSSDIRGDIGRGKNGICVNDAGTLLCQGQQTGDYEKLEPFRFYSFDPDGDGFHAWEDDFPLDASETADFEGDGIGDNADPDDDNDGIPDTQDSMPFDTDNDGLNNNIDDDDDSDGILDVNDGSPLDTDNDTLTNDVDTDDDNDGYADNIDAFPLDFFEHLDTDGDGIGNNADTDDDGDGLGDDYDAFPLDASEQVDTDSDGIGDNADNCPNVSNADQLNSDDDSLGNACDTDDDNDGVADTSDAFPLDAAEAVDTDSDGIGNNADADDDGDGVSDTLDVFPLDSSETVDTDFDGIGNNADTDDDGDNVPDSSDAFPLNASEWADTDLDGIGNNADTDDDGDGVADDSDAFPLDVAESVDTDSDGIGNNADTDDDGDTYADNVDVFPLDSAEWLDTDSDGTGNNADTDDDNDGVLDGSDAFPLDASESIDTDSDGVGNNADTDDDGDSVLDVNDAFPLDSTESVDTDSDGIGNNTDLDDDNDGVSDTLDDFPLDGTEWVDTDVDGIGNNEDADDDNDGIPDTQEIEDGTDPLDADSLDTDRDGVIDSLDLFPLDSTEWSDADSDGIGNNADTDDDNDGVSDSSDAFPLDSTETVDTDSDGIGNNADTDDDGDGADDLVDVYPLNSLYSKDSDLDGMPDAWEIRYGLDPNDPSDASSDVDNDGAVALQEFIEGTIPAGSLDIDGNGQYDALTDGLLLLRGMFLLSGDALISNAVASDAVYKTSDEVTSRIDMLGDLVDIDGNGKVDALTDGLVILRYLFNLRGDVLINDVIASDATVKTAEDVEAKIEQLIPAL